MTKQKTKQTLLAELKAAQGRKINFNGEEIKVVFNFNTLAILQETYPNPYDAVFGMESMDLAAIREVVYACIKSANTDTEYTQEDVGLLLGYYSEHTVREDGTSEFTDITSTITEIVLDFFPAAKEETEKAVDEAKN